MAKKKLTKTERSERDARHQQVLANAQRTRELAERAQAKLDAKNARPRRGRKDDAYLRMLTARATTMTASDRLIADWISISIFAQRLSGIVSVGLNADEFVNDT